MTEVEFLLTVYKLGKGKPMNVVNISDLKKAAGNKFDSLWRRLVHKGYLDDSFAVGQTRLTDSGMIYAEDISGD